MGARIMSLGQPENKMSKSEPDGCVFLMDKPEDIMRKFKRAVTDCETAVRFDQENKPGISNLLTIYCAATGKTMAEAEAEFADQGYGVFKPAVGEAVVGCCAPFRKRPTASWRTRRISNLSIRRAPSAPARWPTAPCAKSIKGGLCAPSVRFRSMPDFQFLFKLMAALLAAGLISFLATPLVKNLAYKVGAIDVPKDNRRMHHEPIPRLGGLAIFIAFLFTVIVLADIDRTTRGILLGAIMIVILGVMDDIMTLKALPKFWCRLPRRGWRCTTAASSSLFLIPIFLAPWTISTWAGSPFR